MTVVQRRNDQMIDLLRPDLLSNDGPVGVRVYRSTDQLIPNNVWTAFIFDTQRWDDPHDNQWAVAPNPTRLTCQADGIYVITGDVLWDPHAAGIRSADIYLNGATRIALTSKMAVAVDWISQIATTTWRMVVGDFVEFRGNQISGGNLNAVKHADASIEFSMVRCP